jgi:hypothetical protein
MGHEESQPELRQAVSHYVPCPADRGNVAQVDQVRFEARVVEAAAEQRIAAALALQRAELVTQACNWLCM